MGLKCRKMNYLVDVTDFTPDVMKSVGLSLKYSLDLFVLPLTWISCCSQDYRALPAASFYTAGRQEGVHR